MKKNRGFTLIELMIVVLIIGILSGITLGVLNSGGIRQKAKDAQRVADTKRIQTALELYFSDKRGYPKSATWASVNTALSTLAGPYIDKIPTDPGGSTGSNPCAASTSGNYYSYITENTASTYASQYILTSRMEVSSSDDISTCTSLTNWSSIGCGTPPSGVYCYGVQNQ